MVFRSQYAGKEMESSSHKRDQSVPQVSPAPSIPHGQQCQFGLNAGFQFRSKWYRAHIESKYFLDVREFPHIIAWIQKLQDPSECNINMVREFYVNF